MNTAAFCYVGALLLLMPWLYLPCAGAATNQPPELVDILECRNHLDDPEVFAEWQKIEQALKENSITNIGAFGSIFEVVFVPADQAQKARDIVSQMIKEGKIDAQKMHLRVLDESRGTFNPEAAEPQGTGVRPTPKCPTDDSNSGKDARSGGPFAK